MNLHEHKEEFEELIAIVADYIGVPADAVRRDYYIVQMMQNLQNSEYTEVCVFKGGTSLSKCYPGSINRFSEDIDISDAASEGVPGESRKDSSKGLLFPLWMRCSFQSRILKRHGADAVITVIGSAIQASIHRPWN